MKPRFSIFAFISFLAMIMVLSGFQQDKKAISSKFLIGKWKYAGSLDNPFGIPDLEFNADSTAKIIPPNKSVENYTYFVKKDSICLRNSIGVDIRIHIAKLIKDSLQINWTIYGKAIFDYYRIK
jgi:hypothetical protein